MHDGAFGVHRKPPNMHLEAGETNSVRARKARDARKTGFGSPPYQSLRRFAGTFPAIVRKETL